MAKVLAVHTATDGGTPWSTKCGTWWSDTPACTMNPAKANTIISQKARVRIACRSVKLISSVADCGRRPDADSRRAELAPPSGSSPKSSGRRAISSIAGITPTASVQMPRVYQAASQPQTPMIACATNGMTARPDPCDIWFSANAKGRRRTNQLLTATDVPNSSGPENAMRPGTYTT